MICPVCVANAAVVVLGAGTTGGGLSAVAWRILRWRKTAARFVGRAVVPSAGRGGLHAAGEAAQR
jgi:hypothetical protein